LNTVQALVFSGFLASLAALHAQESPPELRLDVMVRLGNPSPKVGLQESIWEETATRKLENGRPIVLRLEKNNLLILTSFTPYLQPDARILVVIQAEARRVDDSGLFRGVSSTLQTVIVSLDEPMIFFPFGRREGENSLALEFAVHENIGETAVP